MSNSRGGDGDSGGERGGYLGDASSDDDSNDGGGVRGGWPQQAAPSEGLRGGGGFSQQGFSQPNQAFAPYDPSRDDVRGGGSRRGQWRAIGGDGEWRGTHAVTGWKGRIYASHSNGKVFAIDPDSGQWQQVGASSGWSTRLMFGMGEYLVLVERSGTAWALDPLRGGHLQVGKDGEWANIDAADATDQHVYCHSTQGGLWQFTPPAHWQQLGASNGWKSRFVFAGRGVTTFEQDHSLYRVDPTTGQHVGLGRTAHEVRAGVGVHGHVYANFDDGGIWDLDLETARWSAVGDARTWQSQALIATGGRLFTLEGRGSFFEVYV